MTPLQRSYRARAAAYSRWARPTAREEQAEAARAALWRRFEQQVDPQGVLDDETRRELAMSAARAHSAKMNLARQRRRRE
jgi:hypothetical protein